MDIANVSFFSDTTHDNLTDRYVFPAVNSIYNAHKELIILTAREKESFNLLCYRTCNSTGYSAKYGTYGLVKTKSIEIVEFNVIYVAQAGNSAKT